MPVKKKKAAFLGKGEPPAFRIENKSGKGIGVVCCDHASNRVPKVMKKTLGVSKRDLARHIGWDIGAENVALSVAKALDMPAVIPSYSRLVVDLNRPPSHPQSMPEISDPFPRGKKHVRLAVAGNKGLKKDARKARLDALFWPYQNAIGKTVDGFLKKGRTPVLISIHSFTPDMDGSPRPWHLSILWNKEERAAKKLIAALRKNNKGVIVGENEPYTLKDARLRESTLGRNAESKKIPYVFVEFRQDLIDTPKKAEKWAKIFVKALRETLPKAPGA